MTHWLTLFLDEREIDRSVIFRLEAEGTVHFVTMETVGAYILSMQHRMQERIKNKLLEIDHYDGNVMLFFRDIAQSVVSAQSAVA